MEQKTTKVTKASVHYRTGHFSTRCGNCTMFSPPAGCTHVMGIISAQGVCDDFDPKRKRAAA